MMLRNVLSTLCLGMILGATGCGGEASFSEEEETLGSAEQALSHRDEQPDRVPNKDPVPSSTPGMGLEEFQNLAIASVSRCTGSISQEECKTELDYALGKMLITRAVYDWGLAEGYYPVVDRKNRIGAVCKCGCFEASTLVLVQGANGAPEWSPAKKIRKDTRLVALGDGSTLSRPQLEMKPIRALTSGEETPALYVFSLDNGRKLKVTQNHGMLLSDGRVVEARTLGAGAEFVALDGSRVRVVSLGFERTHDNVYNFEVDAKDKAGHFIAAEGVLVGDLAWQNQLSREIGSIAVRR